VPPTPTPNDPQTGTNRVGVPKFRERGSRFWTAAPGGIPATVNLKLVSSSSAVPPRPRRPGGSAPPGSRHKFDYRITVERERAVVGNNADKTLCIETRTDGADKCQRSGVTPRACPHHSSPWLADAPPLALCFASISSSSSSPAPSSSSSSSSLSSAALAPGSWHWRRRGRKTRGNTTKGQRTERR
jgi:hypothetical protein